MKKFLTTVVLTAMLMTMCIPTVFAEESVPPMEESIPFEEEIPVLTSISSDVFGGVTVEWEPVEGAEEYALYRKEADAEKWTRWGFTKETSYTNKDLEIGQLYIYTVRAYKNNREIYSKRNLEGLQITPQSKVLSLTSVQNIGMEAIGLTWEKQPGSAKYFIDRKEAGGKWETVKTLSNAGAWTDTAVTNGTKYTYRIRAERTVSGEKYSTAQDNTGKTVTCSCKKAVVEVKSVKNTGLEAVTVKWGKLTGADSYRVYRRTTGGEYKLLKSGVAGTSYTDKTAKNGETYIYSVRASRKRNGKAYYSGWDNDGLKIKSAPAEKVQLRNITAGFNAAKITWKAVDGADSYHVLRKTGSGKWERIASYVCGTSYTDRTQKAKTTYSYSVRAVKKIADGSRILTGYDKTGLSAKAAAPKTVEMKSAKKVRFRTAEITWKSVLGADGYGVYRRTARGEWKWLANVTETKYTDRTPDMDVKYYYSVRAYRTYDGKKSWSGRDNTGITLTLKSDIDPKKPMVALTYDDGPGKHTGKILDVLEKYDAHATFFVVGRNAANNPSVLKRAYDLGCEIGNHSYTHPSLTSISNSKIDSEISRTDEAIKKAIGVTPDLLRPPYGADNERVRSRVDKPFIEWSVDTRDWEHRSASKNLASVKKNAKDGSIILMHDIHKCTADSAESIVSYLKKKGYQLVTVSELAYYKGYSMKDGNIYRSFY